MSDDNLPTVTPVPVDTMDFEKLDRMTATFTLVYEQADEQPVSSDTVASLVHKRCDEEPYQRRIALKDEWQELDYGWLKGQVGHILIINRSTVPNFSKMEVESEDDENQTIEVKFDCGDSPHADMTVPNGSFLFFKPTDAGNVRVRCRKGRSKIHLMVTPG